MYICTIIVEIVSHQFRVNSTILEFCSLKLNFIYLLLGMEAFLACHFEIVQNVFQNYIFQHIAAQLIC